MPPSQPKPQPQPLVFRKGYADAYDLLYTDKNYEAECDMIEEVFKRYGDGPIKSILDLGCGTGNPRREFMYSDDMADACVFIMNLNKDASTSALASTSASSIASVLNPQTSIINIGMGEDITIRELTQMVAEVVGFKGEIRWDTTKPDGTPRKLLDVSLLHSMGWKHRTPFEEALRLTYKDFLQQMSINKSDPGTFF